MKLHVITRKRRRALEGADLRKKLWKNALSCILNAYGLLIYCGMDSALLSSTSLIQTAVGHDDNFLVWPSAVVNSKQYDKVK